VRRSCHRGVGPASLAPRFFCPRGQGELAPPSLPQPGGAREGRLFEAEIALAPDEALQGQGVLGDRQAAGPQGLGDRGAVAAGGVMGDLLSLTATMRKDT
jgi:hypothetical protein